MEQLTVKYYVFTLTPPPKQMAAKPREHRQVINYMYTNRTRSHQKSEFIYFKTIYHYYMVPIANLKAKRLQQMNSDLHD